MTTRIVKAHLQMLGFTVLLGGSFIASATISNSLPPMVITWVSLMGVEIYAVVPLLCQSAILLKRLKNNGSFSNEYGQKKEASTCTLSNYFTA